MAAILCDETSNQVQSGSSFASDNNDPLPLEIGKHVLQSPSIKPRTDASLHEDLDRNLPVDSSQRSQLVAHGKTKLATYLASPLPDPNVQQILRIIYADQFLSDLRRISAHARTPRAACYADSLLKTLRAMRDATPTDPFLEVAMALHDALAHDNGWRKYSSSQYAEAHTQLSALTAQSLSRDSAVERAILALEELGFDTTPFEGNLDLDEALDEETA